MALALLAILIVLVVGWLAPELARLRHFLWLRDWVVWLDLRVTGLAWWSNEYGLALVLLPLLALVALIDWTLGDTLHGLLQFGFALIVLFLCWGPRDLDDDARQAARAETTTDRSEALTALGGSPREQPVRSRDLVESVFSAGLTRWFAPLFWFVAFGPTGVVGYRLLQLLAQSPELRSTLPPAQVDAAAHVHAAVAWLPAQLMTLALALASDFDAVGKAWREHHAAHGQGLLHLDLGFLSATARACVDVDDQEFIGADGSPIRDEAVEEARRLLWRLLVVWLVLLSIIVLAGWAS
jgi:AmpE protein